MSAGRQPWRLVGILAFTQLTGWGSLYSAFTILAPGILREFGWPVDVVYGAYSLSLLVSGVVATPIGILLDRFGGRWIMGGGSVLAGAGLLWLSAVRTPAGYFTAWTVIGVAMALVLYEAAFATINREVEHNARRAISTLTLFGGLASTVFWPLTLKLDLAIGWRHTYAVYGLLQLAVCAPLHALLSAGPRRAALPATPVSAMPADAGYTLADAVRHPAFWKLAFAFSSNLFIFSALSVHLVPVLHRLGHPVETVVWFAALIGPMQVA
ncbi:MAG: MFS transporter, partial [Burkholderiaceae bacterium]